MAPRISKNHTDQKLPPYSQLFVHITSNNSRGAVQVVDSIMVSLKGGRAAIFFVDVRSSLDVTFRKTSAASIGGGQWSICTLCPSRHSRSCARAIRLLWDATCHHNNNNNGPHWAVAHSRSLLEPDHRYRNFCLLQHSWHLWHPPQELLKMRWC
jgi:hypothetical protein